jgi:hypothetical protein
LPRSSSSVTTTLTTPMQPSSKRNRSQTSRLCSQEKRSFRIATKMRVTIQIVASHLSEIAAQHVPFRRPALPTTWG